MKRFAKWLLNWIGWLFTLAITSIVVVLVAGVLVFKNYTKDLPDYSQLAKYDPPTVSRLYAADGKLMAEYATEKRVFVPLSAMPKLVTHAFLAAEDKNFYEHSGIDFYGILRAVYTNIKNYGQGRSLVGGSTITQQVVKNFLLTDEKSLERKVKEAVLAVRLSQVYSKDKILELYLNEIFLGLRSYGVAAAALNYFNKSLDELSIEEAAMLAALPKAPASYDPRKNYEAAKERRDWVIQRMAEDGIITDGEAATAKKMPITLRTRASDEVASAEFFAEEVRRIISSAYGQNAIYEGGLVVRTTLDPNLQKTADRSLQKALIEYDRRRGYRGALAHVDTVEDWAKKLADIAKQDHHLIEGQKLAIVTALDEKKANIGFEDAKTGVIPFSLMKWTRRVISDGVVGPEVRKPADILKVGDVIIAATLSDVQKKTIPEDQRKTAWDLAQEPAVNGALVVLDPHTGRVLALSGGYAYGGTQFNRATQAMRQPGSAFKPFVYLDALENGYTPSSIVEDAPVELNQGAGQGMWRPQNYHEDYLGPTTMRVGLEKSRNTMTVRIGQMLGMDRILEIGKRFGIYENPPRNMSIVLGTSETSLVRLTNAYAMIVNGGKQLRPTIIERIDDRHGKTIFRRDNRKCDDCNVNDVEMTGDVQKLVPPIPQNKNEQIVDPRVAYQMVSMLEGVAIRGTAARAGKELAQPVAGKTGTTNDSNDTWFVGFTPDLVVGTYIGYDRPQTLGKRETGASVALPAFINFMKEALKNSPPTPFRVPPGIQLTKVDLHTGLSLDQVEQPGTVIQEAFVIGEPIFMPETAANLPPLERAASSVPSSGGLPQDQELNGQGWQNTDPTEALPAPIPVPEGTPTHPSEGTGGLY